MVGVAILLGLVAILVVLALAELLLPVGGEGDSMAPTIPACEGRGIAEGFTYRLRDPHRGEIVVFNTPPAAQQMCGASGTFVKRLIGLPGETVTERPGGFKGMGEGGAIGAPAAVINAVNDALTHLGITMTQQPLSPDAILAALLTARE